MEEYGLLVILNFLNLFSKNNILISVLFTFIWSYFFINNIHIKTFLVLILLFFNTLVTYIVKYTNVKKKNKIPVLISINNVIFSVLILQLFKNKYFVDKMSIVKSINFVLIMYSLLSLGERIGHKYVMHCNVEGKLNKIAKKNIITKKLYSDICESHIAHHLEVKPNMDLDYQLMKQNSKKIQYREHHGLFMTWDIAILVFFIAISISLPINKFFFKFDIKYILIFCVILSILWCYFWNKTHPEMHNTDIKLDLKEGPIEHQTDMNVITQCLLGNHTNHHLQKGHKKGNFNVIFLGADEWFNNNNVEIDNNEYCLNHKNEEICKK